MDKRDRKRNEVPVGEKVAAEQGKRIPTWRQCPLCWGNYNGVGKATSTQNRKRYYKCDQCGFNWHVELTISSIRVTEPTFDSE